LGKEIFLIRSEILPDATTSPYEEPVGAKSKANDSMERLSISLRPVEKKTLQA
jgi:hypothetical protein